MSCYASSNNPQGHAKCRIHSKQHLTEKRASNTIANDVSHIFTTYISLVLLKRRSLDLRLSHKSKFSEDRASRHSGEEMRGMFECKEVR
jgi:hypothetical protein